MKGIQWTLAIWATSPPDGRKYYTWDWDLWRGDKLIGEFTLYKRYTRHWSAKRGGKRGKRYLEAKGTIREVSR